MVSSAPSSISPHLFVWMSRRLRDSKSDARQMTRGPNLTNILRSLNGELVGPNTTHLAVAGKRFFGCFPGETLWAAESLPPCSRSRVYVLMGSVACAGPCGLAPHMPTCATSVLVQIKVSVSSLCRYRLCHMVQAHPQNVCAYAPVAAKPADTHFPHLCLNRQGRSQFLH